MTGILFGWFIFVFAAIRMIVSFVNMLSNLYLPEEGDASGSLVSVLIPARNEAHNLPNLLHALMKQDHSEIEILVYDDHSEDNTAEVVRQFAKEDNRIKFLSGEPLPRGWFGKNHACNQLASNATGEYLLFLDADVDVSHDLVRKSVAFSRQNNLSLLSIFPQQKVITGGERLTVPLMNWILLTLLPMVLVRKSRNSSLAAANGQFMLFEANCYKSNWWHEQVKNSLVEDIEIIRMMKKENCKVATLLGNKDVSCRMYSSFKEGLNGFAKNVIEFFGGSSLLAALFTVLIATGVFIIPFALGIEIFFIYLVVVILTKVFVSITSRQSVINNLLFHIPQMVTFLIMVFKGIQVKQTGKYYWKGRKIKN
ncbi:MAG: glycosyltransferase [Bacteroidota bacterium]